MDIGHIAQNIVLMLNLSVFQDDDEAIVKLSRLSALEGMVMTKLRAEYTSWRVTRSMRMRWSDKIQTVLDEGLVLLEAASCSSQRRSSSACLCTRPRATPC